MDVLLSIIINGILGFAVYLALSKALLTKPRDLVEEDAVHPNETVQSIRNIYPECHKKPTGNFRIHLEKTDVYKNNTDLHKFTELFFYSQVVPMIQKAEKFLPTKKPFDYNLEIAFDILDGAHGTAGVVRLGNWIRSIRIELNLDSTRMSEDDMITDTLPHEVAHIYLYHYESVNGIKGSFQHNNVWRELAQHLGSDGSISR